MGKLGTEGCKDGAGSRKGKESVQDSQRQDLTPDGEPHLGTQEGVEPKEGARPGARWERHAERRLRSCPVPAQR